MAPLDSRVAQVLDHHHHAADSDDEDALIASLEDSPAVDAFREQRLQQLHAEFTRAKAQKSSGFGAYTEIKEEKALMDLTAALQYAVLHFAKDDFARCGVMDAHLETLAAKHFDTRFLKIKVENAPFLVTKLRVQVLPCVIVFVDGVSVDRIVGFEGLGYTPDTFTTQHLEARLLTSGVVQRVKTHANQSSEARRKEVQADDGDDDDWD